VEIGELSDKKFTNLGLREYPECGTPLEVLEYHQIDGKSLAMRISGHSNIEQTEQINQKYSADAPQ
jgi:transketolase